MAQKTLIKYFSDFIEYCEVEKGLSLKTQENYGRFLNKFFFWLKNNHLDTLTPDKLSEEIVWKYRIFLSRSIDQVKHQSLKKSTQNYYLIALRSLLSFFIEKNISSLPPAKIKLAKDRSEREIKFLKLDQLEKLLSMPGEKNIIALRDSAILESLFSTGLRVSELCALNRDDLRIKDGQEIEISVVGKGSKVRAIYFSVRAVKAIKKYLDRRGDLDPALFINFSRASSNGEKNRRLTVKSIETIVKKYIKMSGIPVDATPHTLRHSFATDLLNAGVDLRLVQEFLGHSNIATTQIYTHVTNKQLKDIHKRVHDRHTF